VSFGSLAVYDRCREGADMADSVVSDEKRNEVIIALADALVEIAREYRELVDLERVERHAKRLEAESAKHLEVEGTVTTVTRRAIEFASADDEIKSLAGTAYAMKRLADDALQAHAEAVAQARDHLAPPPLYALRLATGLTTR
jgi:hypothetical protein